MQPNIEFNDDRVKKLSDFINHLSNNFQNEKNFEIAKRVLECLIFIKLNSEWITYAISNKNDRNKDDIYKNDSDRNKKVLRAHNGMSFHIVNYDNAEQAIRDYGRIIESIENNIDILMGNDHFARSFIRKIDDSSVGCMEARLSGAMRFLADPQIVNLSDLFEKFLFELNQKKINQDEVKYFANHLLDYFEDKLDTPVIISPTNKKEYLSFDIIMQYLCDYCSYELKEFSALPYLKQASISTKRNGKRKVLCFTNKEDAENCLSFILMSLPNDLFKEARNAEITSETDFGTIKYEFELTIEQWDFVKTLHQFEEAKININATPKINVKIDPILSVLSIIPNKIAPSSDGEWFFYTYSLSEEAETQMVLLHHLLDDQYPEFKEYGKIINTKNHQETPHRIRLSKAQHQQLEELRYHDRLIKSVRFDELCFIDDFIESMTHTADKIIEPRKQLRFPEKKHKAYTAFAEGVFSRDNKPSPYPSQDLEQKKAERSRHQSTSLITKKAQVPVFGHDKERKLALVGVMLDPDDALYNRFFIYDKGTIERPYEFHAEHAAKKYHNEMTNKILFSSYEKFKQAIEGGDQTKYNEVLARIRWHQSSSCIAIFSDTLESRAVSQIYAKRLREQLIKNAQKTNEAWDDQYQIPIAFYIPHDSKNMTAYTLKMQKADQDEAQLILNDQTKRENAFSNNQFAFLLLCNPHDVLKITYNNKPIILILVENGLLHVADMLLEYANEKSLDIYLEQLLSSQQSQYEDQSGFVAAVQKNRINEINILLKYAADLINKKYKNDDTALTLAANKGHTEVVKTLLAHKANIEAKDNNGNTALTLAANKGHTEVVKTLLAHKANIEAKDNNGYTALTLAAYQGHVEVVKTLLAHKANIEAKNNNGYTALTQAAYQGHVEVVKTLLAHKANIEAKNNNGNTALTQAAYQGHAEVVKTLLAHKANIEAKDNNGSSPVS